MSNKTNKPQKDNGKAQGKAKEDKIWFIIAAVVAVITVAVIGWLLAGPKAPEKEPEDDGVKAITVSIIFKDNSMWATTFPTDKECLGDALVAKKLLKPEDYVDGKILTIKEETADYEADKAVWKLYVNAEEAGSDIYNVRLEDGKDYRLEYTVVE